MDKRLFAMVLAFCLCFHVPAYASGASPSDALKVGAALDAEPWHSLDVGLDDDFGVMPLVDGLYGQDWFYQSAWLNTETQKAEYFIVKRSNGRYLWENPDPDVYTPLPRFTVYLTKSMLPAPGTYNLKWRMDSANVYPTINRLAFQYVLRKANTAPLYESLVSAGFHTHNTYWNGNTNITIPSNLSDLTLIFYINQPSDNLHPFDMGEFTYMFYQKTDASADGSVSPPSAPPSTPEQDIANDLGIISGVVDSISGAVSDISGGIGSLVSLQEQTNNLILQVVQTISNQLEAFWNQLAGEFTNLYNKLTDQHNELMDADRTNVEDHMENDDKNTDRIIDELGREHDQDRNGYDDQGWRDQKDKIDGVIADYEDAENELLGGAKDNLNNFAFDNPFTQFNVVMADISPILTGIYDALGSFNIPIGFSLTLTVAMLCIGWYRFKGGL